ncbi:MAG TPA: hypothetical protein VFI53_15495 [Myxococcaceae bacterium]|nr:hypothetical protein [Myxococcaceae bacterium]
MRVHAFVARPEDLRLILKGEAPGVPLTGVDPLNLSSLAEIVTSGEVPSSRAAETLRTPVLSAGPHGPTLYAVPEEITEALGNSDAGERARWIKGWTGGTGPERGKALAEVAELVAARDRSQALYLWVGD